MVDARRKLTCWSCAQVFVDIGKQPLACPRCGAQPGVMPEFPAMLLEKVAWSFADKQPKDVAALRAAIAKQYADVYKKPAPADEVYAVRIPSCRVVLASYHLVAPVVVEHPTTLDAGELLVGAHRLLASKLRKRDHHFFQGFVLKEAEPDKPPVYDISLGS